jgi:hypothetical protein
MSRVFSLTAGARLLGISTSTLSRHLPPERVRKGQAAKLTVDELVQVAREVRIDPEQVRQRAIREVELEADMPDSFGLWLRVAEETGLVERVQRRWNAGTFEALPDETAEAPPLELPTPWHAGFRALSMRELEERLHGRGE